MYVKLSTRESKCSTISLFVREYPPSPASLSVLADADAHLLRRHICSSYSTEMINTVARLINDACDRHSTTGRMFTLGCASTCIDRTTQ